MGPFKPQVEASQRVSPGQAGPLGWGIRPLCWRLHPGSRRRREEPGAELQAHASLLGHRHCSPGPQLSSVSGGGGQRPCLSNVSPPAPPLVPIGTSRPYSPSVKSANASAACVPSVLFCPDLGLMVLRFVIVSRKSPPGPGGAAAAGWAWWFDGVSVPGGGGVGAGGGGREGRAPASYVCT